MEITPKDTKQPVEPGVAVEVALGAVSLVIARLTQATPPIMSVEESLILGGDGGMPKSLVSQRKNDTKIE